jgi:glycosyltransferase involved in cell wall biosynthesis
LAASWHTNLHEYAEKRALPLVRILPEKMREQLGVRIRASSLAVLLRFYKFGQVLFAPNHELVDLLATGTGRPVHLMERGVDSNLFAPERRQRLDTRFIVGYVGRLTAEKNVRVLPEVERALLASGFSDFRFLVVGQGAEEPWLRANLQNADFAGVLKGEALARAYASMDAFAFPSQTETFGNVILEALASGVPAIVTDCGGPQFIVRHGETGFVAHDVAEFARWILHLARNPQKLQLMREMARAHAVQASWDAIFSGVYAAYHNKLQSVPATAGRIGLRRPGVVVPWPGQGR